MNKKSLNKRYAEQFKEGLREYGNRNGSGRGWKKSEEYKRVLRNKKQAFYRYEKKKVKGGAKRISDSTLMISGEDVFFFSSLSEEGAAINIWREIEQSGQSPTAITIFFDNEKRVKKSEQGYISDIADLFRQAAKIQNYYRSIGEQAYPTIVVKAGVVSGRFYIITEGISPKVDMGPPIVLIKESPNMIKVKIGKKEKK